MGFALVPGRLCNINDKNSARVAIYIYIENYRLRAGHQFPYNINSAIYLTLQLSKPEKHVAEQKLTCLMFMLLCKAKPQGSRSLFLLKHMFSPRIKGTTNFRQILNLVL